MQETILYLKWLIQKQPSRVHKREGEVSPTLPFIVHETFMEKSLFRETPCSKKILVVRPEVAVKKVFLKNLQTSQEKTCGRVSF